MNVLLVGRYDGRSFSAGDTVVITRMQQYLREAGVTVDVVFEDDAPYHQYDVGAPV